MKYLDYVLIAWTYIKKRFVESLIITLGIALGIGSIASGLAILEFFNKQIFNEEKNKPYYREIYVGQFASSDRNQ